MTTIAFIGFLLSVIIAVASIVAERSDRIAVTSVVLFYGCICFAVLFNVNEVYPFAEGGDDKRYYEQSLRKLRGIAEWFDFSYAHRYQEQGGYGMLLTWVGQFVGESLFLRKCVNVAWYLLLSLVWYSIGRSVGGRAMARAMFFGVLLCTPLWYFWLFLLKDMTVVLLQSIALLGVVRFFADGRKIQGMVILLISTVLIVPFRVYLVMVNMAVAAAGSVFFGGQKRAANFLVNLSLVLAFVGGGIVLGTNKSMLESLGAKGAQRTLSADSIKGNLDDLEAAKEYQLRSDRLYIIKYPVLFLIGETSGLNPAIWGYRSATRIRGVVALPWIFLGVPLFVIGVARVFRWRGWKVHSDSASPGGHSQRAILLTFLAFIGIYVIFAWVSTDTTRWRMPVMPVMIGVSVWAWLTLSRSRRLIVMSGWFVSLLVFSSGYYLFRQAI